MADEAMSLRRRPAGHLRLITGSDGPTTTIAAGTSALAHTNRHGVAFYLHQGTTKTGKPKYYVAKTLGTGILAEMPTGFEFAESVNGVVSIRRVDNSPKRIADDDVELVRSEVSSRRVPSLTLLDALVASIRPRAHAHVWRPGHFVAIDNLACVHGREALDEGARRSLPRVAL